jgi:hypothetical protein
MEYVSDGAASPRASGKNGYWVSGKKVYDLTACAHVTFIIEHPDLFHLTAEGVNEVYARHNEAVGMEGSARDELVRHAASQGWIRVKHYTEPYDYWSIQCHETGKQRPDVREFITWAIANGIMQENDPAMIIGFKDQGDLHEYKWEDGGIKQFMAETP